MNEHVHIEDRSKQLIYFSTLWLNISYHTNGHVIRVVEVLQEG